MAGMVAQKLGEAASIGVLALAFALSGCASGGTRAAVATLTVVESPSPESPESRLVRTR